jgi:MoaA/NifB/PqqE/SkfB family radical SAM enzyme
MSAVINIKTSDVKLFPAKNLTQYCTEPYETISVADDGRVYMCGCSGWLPTSVGNLFTQSLEDILASKIAHDIRNSVKTGSYVYCDGSRCGLLNNNQLMDYDQLTAFRKQMINTGTYSVKSYYISGDRTCNLSCPSCRTEVINLSDQQKKSNANYLLKLFPTIEQSFTNHERKTSVHLSTSGEFLSSPLLLEFLDKFPVNNNVEFWFQSNGLLFLKRWHRIKHLQHNIFNITITADSCVPNVYAQLRRGGKFQDLVDNLKFIQKLKSRLGFKFYLRMVVQQANCEELYDFYAWAKTFDVDVVDYTKMQNWAMSPAEYQQANVFDPDHAQYKQTVMALRDLKTRDDVLVNGVTLISP